MKYSLQKNPLLKEGDGFMARVIPQGVKSVDDLIIDMREYHSTVTDADTKAVLEIFFNVVSRNVANGYFVNLPIANFRPSVTGNFTALTDSIDRNRHTVGASISTGTLLNQAMASAQFLKVNGSVPSPTLIEFTDCTTQLTNSKATPNSVATIIGSELKFDPKNDEEGLFFVPSQTGSEVKVQTFASISANKIVFNIPALQPGSYAVVVRKGYCNGKVIRSGSLDTLITVG